MQKLEEVFGVNAPIIGMAHFPPLPGSPLYENEKIGSIRDQVLSDVIDLAEGGIDAVMFCNEGDRPYVNDLSPATISTMARVIGEIKASLKDDMPLFGTDILWSPKGAIALAKSTGARFVREVFTGAFEGENGIWDTNCGETLRYQKLIAAGDLTLLFNINAEFAKSLSGRDLSEVAQSAVFASLADIVVVSGPMTGSASKFRHLEVVKNSIPDTPVFANTGVNIDNVEDILSIADGVVIGSSLKVDGDTWNPVDRKRVTEFMKHVNDIRS